MYMYSSFIYCNNGWQGELSGPTPSPKLLSCFWSPNNPPTPTPLPFGSSSTISQYRIGILSDLVSLSVQLHTVTCQTTVSGIDIRKRPSTSCLHLTPIMAGDTQTQRGVQVGAEGTCLHTHPHQWSPSQHLLNIVVTTFTAVLWALWGEGVRSTSDGMRSEELRVEEWGCAGVRVGRF